MIPEDLKYTKSHEWVKIKDQLTTVGITHFAAEQLGDITLVEFPQVGDMVSSGDSIGTIESVKAVSDFYAPVSGKVIAINEDLEDSPEKVNEDSFGSGWIVKIEVPEEFNDSKLLDAVAYEEYLDSMD
jgi:glycine cleavage system H protein